MTFHELSVLTSDNTTIDFKDFKNKTVIIFNSASACALNYQLKELDALLDKYGKDQLVILGFPSNEFGQLEPHNNKDIGTVYRKLLNVSFPIAQLTNTNGKEAHPVFQFLKREHKAFLSNRVKWNFTKFIVSPQGKVLKRFKPYHSIKKIDLYLENIILPDN